jgi:hypothetical protein
MAASGENLRNKRQKYQLLKHCGKKNSVWQTKAN